MGLAFCRRGVGRRRGGAHKQIYHKSGEKSLKKNKGKEDRVIQKEEGSDVFIISQSGTASPDYERLNFTLLELNFRHRWLPFNFLRRSVTTMLGLQIIQHRSCCFSFSLYP